MALSAICAGERGTCGLRSWVPPDPVTAQVMKTSLFMVNGMGGVLCLGAVIAFGRILAQVRGHDFA
jgi:hypothetical protein